MATSIIRVEAELNPEALRLLTQIRDRLPAPAQAAAAPLKGSELADAKRHALRAVLEVLDGWIEGAQSNHDACDHRGESQGSECWRSFTPADIRAIVNDAAREVGVKPYPTPRNPVEDRPLERP